MSMDPLHSISNEPISLAKLATIFAVVFGIAFGLCSVSALTGGLGSQKMMPALMITSVVIEAACLLGLLVLGALAIVRYLRRNSQD